MTIPSWIYGEAATALGLNQFQENVTTKANSPPIQGDRFARNGQHPDVSFINKLNEGVNQAVCYRTRSVFDSFYLLNDAPFTSSTDEVRYYFSFYTGPFHHSLYGIMGLLPAWDSSSTTIRNAAARVDIYSDATMSTLVTSETFTYGQYASAIVGFEQIRAVKRYITGLAPNTNYFASISVVDNARIFGATIMDLQSMTQEYDGWLPQNVTTHSAILDKYRSDQAAIMNDLWRYGGAKVLNWQVSRTTSPRSTLSTTPTNLIDGTSTTISSGTPGFVLDMTNKARLSQSSGVPIVMQVCATYNSHATGGEVKLVDSGGTTIASCGPGFGWTNAGPSWESTTGTLPATSAKYDLQFVSDGAFTMSVYSVCIFERG